MHPKKIVLPILLLFGVLSFQFQCGKDYPGADIPLKYAFKEQVSITPYKLNYAVGDTIWLSMHVQYKKLFDEKTNTRVYFDSANFNMIAQIDLLFNNPFIGTGPFGSYVFQPGIQANTGNGGAQTYAHISAGCSPSLHYDVNVGIVLLHKGVFGISLFSSAIRKCFVDGYQNASLTLSFDVADTHKQFYQQLRLIDIGKKLDEYILSRLDKKSMVVINVQ